jgi:uncharacterized membrane protein YccF (DUF307 family)
VSSDSLRNASSVIVTRRQGPPFLVRVLWYLFIGWWLTGISLALGYLAAITIVGLPLAFWIFNRTGTLLTLRPRPVTVSVSHDGGVTVVESGHREQRSLLLRVVYFVLVGWWAALIWMTIAYFLCLTILLLPVGLMMLNRLPEVFTLHRN